MCHPTHAQSGSWHNLPCGVMVCWDLGMPIATVCCCTFCLVVWPVEFLTASTTVSKQVAPWTNVSVVHGATKDTRKPGERYWRAAFNGKWRQLLILRWFPQAGSLQRGYSLATPTSGQQAGSIGMILLALVPHSVHSKGPSSCRQSIRFATVLFTQSCGSAVRSG